MILAKNFHPLRGDVAHDTRVMFDDGRVLEVRSASAMGWALFDRGTQVTATTTSAYELMGHVLWLNDRPAQGKQR